MQGDDANRRPDEALEVALFRVLAAATTRYVSCVDRQRRVVYLNRTLSRDLSEVLGKSIDSFIEPEHRAAVVACLDRAFNSGKSERVEYTVVLNDGGHSHIGTRVIPFQGPHGEELALMLTEDVTEHQRLLEQLARSEEFKQRVVEHLPDFVTLIDRERRFVWVNRLASGLSMEDVIGKRLDEFMTAETAELAKPAIQAAFDSQAVGQYESEGYGDGQSRAWYLVRLAPLVVDGKVEHVLLITSDITERKRTERALRASEEQLHRTQHLDSLGQLAGGIAHDFNNLLQVIGGNLSFAQQALGNGEVPVEELEQALRATERAAELTSHLLTIGRRKRMNSKRIELGALVNTSVRMLRRAIPETIALRYEPPVEPCFVELDAPQFDQVLINLCVNARDAMRGGGTLSIRVEPDASTHVVVSVSDSGTGISPQDLPRIFEPFFTTKGAGSGLGLAVAAGIVAAHGGALTAESDGKHGTTMRVRLPRVAATAEQAAAPAPHVPAGNGVVLVADDESMVRAQLVRVLERAGYKVLAAEDGERAVELFRAHLPEIDLAILDVVMPGLDGWQVYLKLEELKPGVKALFTTGYAADVLPDDFSARGARLVSKPYKPEYLLAQVRELLAPTKGS